MPSIAVREAMDGDETVLEAHCDFNFGIGLMFNPVPAIVKLPSRRYGRD